MITPSPDLDTSDPALATNFTMISIQYEKALSWPFVAENTQSTAQLFAVTPTIIQNALNLSSTDDIKMYALHVYQPAGWSGDENDLLTLCWLFIPNGYVSVLQAQLPVRTSALYNPSSAIAAQLASLINGQYPLTADENSNPVNGKNGGSGGGGSGNGGTNDTGGSLGANSARRNAIIGVCVAFGVLGVLVGTWWFMRVYKRKQAESNALARGGPMGGGYGSMAQVAQPLGGVTGAGGNRPWSPDDGMGANPFASPPASLNERDPFNPEGLAAPAGALVVQGGARLRLGRSVTQF
ncbi:hypothetical protein DL93DRAFT_844714 [Clavulina sp. PMI_390]|nr:hypothetical protein DL93DRAFT_844714 [Clavulina sp. PMI_390]